MIVGLLILVGIFCCFCYGESARFFFHEGKGCCSLAFYQCVMDSRGDHECSKPLRLVIGKLKVETNLGAGGTGLTKFVSTNQCGRTEKQQNICLSLNVNHRDIQIEQHLNLGIQRKPKIHGSYNSCILSILSTDRYAATRGTNPLSSLFDCRIKMKYILAAFCLKTHISKASSNFVDWRIPSNRGL